MHNSSGQWKLIPDGDNSKPVRAGATCLCKKAACWRYFLLKDPPQKPGRKRVYADVAVPVGGSINDGIHPPIIESIGEIWGIRICNIAVMGDEERENPLVKRKTEFCVHGEFYRSEEAKNPVYGAWWVRRRWLVEATSQEVVDEAVGRFAAACDETSDEDYEEEAE